MRPLFLAMKKILISAFILLSSALEGQSSFGDKDFQLIDSLDHINLSADDSTLLKTFLADYHKAQADTLRFAIISDFIDNCWNDDLWPLYNEYLFKEVERALACADGDTAYISKLLYFKGTAWGNRAYKDDIIGNYDKAETAYLKALECFKKAKRTDGVGMVINALALIHENRGDLGKAIDQYNTALKIADQFNDHEFQAMALLSIGRLQRNFDQYNQSLQSFKAAEAAALKDSNLRLQGSAIISQATIYYFQHNFDQAMSLCRQGMQLISTSGALQDLHSAYDLLAKIYMFRNQLDSAEFNANKLLESSRQTQSYERLSVAYSILGKISSNRGDKALAEDYYTKAYAINKAIGSYDQLKGDAQDLADLYRVLGKYEKANRYLREYVIIKDSLDHSDFQQKLLRQTAQYEYEKQKEVDEAKHQQDLAIAAKEQERQNTILYALVAIAVVTLLALIYSVNRQGIIKRQKEELARAYQNLEQQKEYEVLASNLKALQSQMNPHFIFNALNSIQTLVLKGEKTSSYSYINRFASLIRKTLDFSEQKLVSLNDELKLLEDYLSLEKLRFRDDFDFQLQADAMPELEIPPMLLQPLIENSLRHGLLHKEGKRELQVQFQIREDGLTCLIRDNGIGREASREINKRQRGDHNSFATGALVKRFKFLQRDYGNDIGFSYTDLAENGEARGTEVLVKLPYRLVENISRKAININNESFKGPNN